MGACIKRGRVVVVDRVCVDVVGLGTMKSSPAEVVDDTSENEKKEKKMKQKREEDGGELKRRQRRGHRRDMGRWGLVAI